jgi:hypothetical protein
VKKLKSAALNALRLKVHPNELATSLLNYDDEVRRLKRFKPTDLSDRFN